jgi:tetratricopeptide (TPR) repeat protein
LAAFYPLDASTPVWRTCIGGVLLIGVTALAIRAGRRHGYFLTGWLWYAGTLVPVIGLVQVGGQSMADRYTYVPLIGLFVAIAWGAVELAARWRIPSPALPLAATCVLALCAALASAQARYWSDSASLWRRALDVTENNYVAHNNLGGVLMKQGNPAEAIPHLAEALRIKPDSAMTQSNLGVALMETGNLDEAIRQFGEALRIDPALPEARDKLASALAVEGKLDQAIAQYTEALRLDPNYFEAHNDLGVAFARQGKLDEAVQQFAEALRIDPGYKDASENLSRARSLQGRGGQ